MKLRKIALILCVVTLIVSAVALCACNTEVKAETVDLDVTSVTLDKDDKTADIPETAEIKATLTGKEDGKTVTEKIQWTVEDTDVATVTVSEDGLTATVKAVAQGETVLNAKIENEEGCASVKITVYKPLGTSKLKLGGTEENNITFYDSNQYVVDASVIAAHDIQYRGEYSVVDGKLNFTPTQFAWGGFITFNAQNVYKQKKQGAVLSISGKEVTSGDVRAILNVKFTEEDMQKLSLTPIASADIKEVAKIAVLNTDSEVFVKGGTDAEPTYTLNLISSANDTSVAEKQLDLSKYFMAVDANGEEPTEEEIEYKATPVTGTVKLDGTMICGLKEGMVLITVSSKDKPTVAQNIIVSVTYPKDVKGYDLANDAHFAEDTTFTATSEYEVLGNKIKVTRIFEFHADGTVAASMMGAEFSWGYYKLDKATDPTKVTITLFNGDMDKAETTITGTGKDAKFSYSFNNVKYDFNYKSVEVVATATDASTDYNGSTATFYDDHTVVFKTTNQPSESPNADNTCTWKIENGALVIEGTTVEFSTMKFVPAATVTNGENGAKNIAFLISTFVNDAKLADSIYMTNATLSAADFAKLVELG